jgi:hypothetical protein
MFELISIELQYFFSQEIGSLSSQKFVLGIQDPGY